MKFGVSSMIASLKKVAVIKPGEALKNADPQVWHYSNKFNPDKVSENHEDFIKALKGFGTEVYFMSEDDKGIADSVFTYDASLMTPSGAIIMSPGKKLRSGEQIIHRQFYENNKIPIVGSVEGEAKAEAGDTLWLDDNTIIIGRGFRTNEHGVIQLKNILTSLDIEVHVFDLPVFSGNESCLHLMSLISIVDVKKALVYLPLLPVGFLELLIKKGFSLIEAPENEFYSSNTLNINILTMSPGKCIMLNNLPETKTALINSEIEVKVFNGDELCIGCEGGPTCLTRPLLRQ